MGKKNRKKSIKAKNGAQFQAIESPNVEKALVNVSDTSELPQNKSVFVPPEVPEAVVTEVVKRESFAAIASLPAPLHHVFPHLTPKQQVLVKLLCSPILGQSHLFEDWPLDDHLEAKGDFVQQLETLNDSCPCGLAGYITNARKLQTNSNGETMMQLGMKDLSYVGFVLVDDDEGNKENNGDVQSWFTTVLSAQTKYTGDKVTLCVVLSSQASVDALEESNYYGLDKSHVSVLLKSGTFPVLCKDNTSIMTDGCFSILTQRPDSLDFFFSSKIAKAWAAKGIKWASFCTQDFDISSDRAMTVKAYRLDSRETLSLRFQEEKAEPLPVELVEVSPTSTECSILEPNKTTEELVEVTGVCVQDFRNVSSLTAPAAKEGAEKKAEDECSCVIL